jgi:YcaO-like protein with predicted kinase domain
MTAGGISPVLRKIAKSIGITRIGDLTGLDITGVPVVQVTRPASRSNLVSQGKGATLDAAVASAIFEAAEGFFAERPEQMPAFSAAAADLGAAGMCFGTMLRDEDRHWMLRQLKWANALNPITGATLPVPLGLVHSCFTAHPPDIGDIFETTTTGLAAGFNRQATVMHGLLECIERDALARAAQTHGIMREAQIDETAATDPQLKGLLAGFRDRGLLCGFWRAPSPSGLPVIWCHIMEDCDTLNAVLPLPAEGSAARLDEQEAMCAALLEAAQSRVTAISGARDDFTRVHYPRHHDDLRLAAHRELLKQGIRMRRPASTPDISGLQGLLAQLHRAGLDDIRIVHLDTSWSPGIHAIKAVMPQLMNFKEAHGS